MYFFGCYNINIINNTNNVNNYHINKNIITLFIYDTVDN